jgi:hypothetical protein
MVSAQWADSEWSYVDNNFPVDVKEDFFDLVAATSTTSTKLGLFKLISVTNANVSSGGLNGKLVISPNSAAAFAMQLNGPQIYGSGDFYMRVVMNLDSTSFLDTKENNGFFIGSLTTNKQIGFVAGSNDSTNIRFLYNNGSIIYDVVMATAGGNYYDLEIERTTNFLNVYSNNVLKHSINTTTILDFGPIASTIVINGLDSPGTAPMVSIDKFFMWSQLAL